MDTEKSNYQMIENTLEEFKAFHERTVKHYELMLKNCVNELCYRCGEYRNEHLGACDGCKWKKVRYGDDE